MLALSMTFAIRANEMGIQIGASRSLGQGRMSGIIADEWNRVLSPVDSKGRGRGDCTTQWPVDYTDMSKL